MNRLLTLSLVAALSTLMGGCATTGDRVGGPLARCDSQRTALSRDVGHRVDVASRVEVFSAASGAREGTPTPEPALPAPDARYAGPTPQVPIPVGGSGNPAARW